MTPLQVIDRELIAQARQLLNEARLIAEAPAAQSSEIGHGHPSGAEPPGAWTYSTSTLDSLGERVTDAIEAGSEHELAKAIEWGRKAIHLLKRGVPGRREETIAERRARIVRNYEGVPAPTIARAERMSTTLVRSDREALGRDPATGAKVPARLRRFG